MSRVAARSCFIHVPKSGGSSVISLLQSSLGEANVFHANASRYQQAPLEFLLSRYPVVAGHFMFAQVSTALLERTFFFTFLREPVDRALSLYYYWLQQARRPEYGRKDLARTLDLETFVAALSDTTRPSPWSNWQTFIFSGATDCEQPATELLRAAMRNLERLDFVGVHEQFDEGMQRLGEVHGWPLRSSPPRVNVTAGRPSADSIDPGLRECFQSLNGCDAVLFARARELWEQAKARPVHHARIAFVPLLAQQRHARVEQGTREIVFTSIEVGGESTGLQGAVGLHERGLIRLRGHSSIAADDVTVGLRISDSFGVEVYGVNTLMLGVDVALEADQDFELTFAFDMILAPGTYQLTVAIHASEDHLHKCYHWIDNAVAFECRHHHPPAFTGLVNLKAAAHRENVSGRTGIFPARRASSTKVTEQSSCG